MPQSSISKAALIAFVFVSFLSPVAAADQTQVAVPPSGIVKVKSDYSVAETIARIKKDVADKGIRFFQEIDQQKLAADAGIKLRPSTLLVFGNPPLGTLFVNANPLAGLDWPVRMLVLEDENGNVWAAYTDFGWIARRHDIKGADLDAFNKASGVIASITSSVKAH
ncbi:MAG TPA: DUF302 domain-containing protein [Casimicrobiaceae bacterium]